MDSNRNLRIVRTSGPSYPYPYKDNVLWVYHDEDNNPVTKIWDHGKWIPFTGNESGSGDITIDTELNGNSKNPVQNKIITQKLNEIADKTEHPVIKISANLSSFSSAFNSGFKTQSGGGTVTSHTWDEIRKFIQNETPIRVLFDGFDIATPLEVRYQDAEDGYYSGIISTADFRREFRIDHSLSVDITDTYGLQTFIFTSTDGVTIDTSQDIINACIEAYTRDPKSVRMIFDSGKGLVELTHIVVGSNKVSGEQEFIDEIGSRICVTLRLSANAGESDFTVRDFTVDLSDYYTKEETNTKLSGYALKESGVYFMDSTDEHYNTLKSLVDAIQVSAKEQASLGLASKTYTVETGLSNFSFINNLPSKAIQLIDSGINIALLKTVLYSSDSWVFSVEFSIPNLIAQPPVYSIEMAVTATQYTIYLKDYLANKPDWNATGENNFNAIQNKPTKLSQFENDKNFDVKDRAYVANQNMGYKVLDKDKSIISQMTEANTIYEIRYDFDLNGETLTVPENCTLKFEGGSLKNGSVVGSSTVVEAGSRDVIFNSVSLDGEFRGEFFADNLSGDDTYIVSTLFYLIANGASKIEFRPNTTYSVTLKYSEKNSKNRRVSQIIDHKSNLVIIGNNSEIIENNTDTTIGSSKNEFWDVLRFVGCSNIRIYDLKFTGNSIPELINTTDGWVFVNLSEECSCINLYNVSAENTRTPLESSSELLNSSINVNVKNTGYAACICGGNNLHISCCCDTTHRVLYLEGVTNSEVTATTNGIKGPVAILLRDRKLTSGDTTTYTPCDNVTINLICDHFAGNDHTDLVGQMFYSSYTDRVTPYDTKITCKITGSTENNVCLFSDYTLLQNDTINADVTFCLDTTRAVWLLNNSEDSKVSQHVGILNIRFSGSNLTGVNYVYQNIAGVSNITLDSVYGRADRGVRIYSGSISEFVSRSNVLYIKNCPLADFSFSDRAYNLPDIFYINSKIKGSKFNKLVDIGSSYKPTIEGLTDAQSVSVTGESSKLYSGASLTSLTIAAAKTDNSQNGAEEVFQFSTGASPTITITGVSWANSDVPTFGANKTYEIHIMYNSTLDKFLATYATYE